MLKRVLNYRSSVKQGTPLLISIIVPATFSPPPDSQGSPRWPACTSSAQIKQGVLIGIRCSLFLHCRIPMILDGIVSPARQTLRNLCPPVPHDPVSQKQTPFFGQRPLILFYMGTQMIMPTLPALLAHPPCIILDVPGKFSAIIVHFCGPCLATSLIKYSSSCSVQARFRPASPNPYTLNRPTLGNRSPLGCAGLEEDFLRASPHYSTSIIINYCQKMTIILGHIWACMLWVEKGRKIDSPFSERNGNEVSSVSVVLIILDILKMPRIGATSFIFLLCLLSMVNGHFGHPTGVHSCGGKPKTEKGKSAICILQPQNNSGVKGVVAMHQPTPLDPIYYEFSVGGLGIRAYHGVHIHQFGDLTQGCQSAGPHYNPYGKTHGGRHDCNRHAGDLGNLRTDGKGVAHMCFTDHGSTLFGDRSIIGRSIVVHKNKDDLGKGNDVESTKTGNSGPRISCGVIGLTSQFKHFSWNEDLKRVQKY